MAVAFTLAIAGSAQGAGPKWSKAATFSDCAGCPEMVSLPAGRFTMGTPPGDRDVTGLSRDARSVADAEGPLRTVTFAKRFALGRTEVTVGQFRKFIEETGYVPGNECWIWTGEKRLIVPPSSSPPIDSTPGKSWRDPNFRQTDNHPVVCVRWSDAKAYVGWLAKKTGKPYRLPSEAEWEYAARAGSTTRYAFGADLNQLCKYENGFDLSAKEDKGPDNGNYVDCRDGYGMVTAPVAKFAANAFGFYDMGGNVTEMVADCLLETYANAPVDGSAYLPGNPDAPTPAPSVIPNMAESKAAEARLRAEAARNPCMYRALRGGGWSSPPVLTRPGFRHWMGMTLHTSAMGFRVARDL